MNQANTPEELFSSELEKVLESVKGLQKPPTQTAIFAFLESKPEFEDFIELLSSALNGLRIYSESVRDSCGDNENDAEIREIASSSLAIINEIRVLIDQYKVLNGIEL